MLTRLGIFAAATGTHAAAYIAGTKTVGMNDSKATVAKQAKEDFATTAVTSTASILALSVGLKEAGLASGIMIMTPVYSHKAAFHLGKYHAASPNDVAPEYPKP